MYSPEWKKRGVVDAEVLRHKIIYISKFRKDIKPLKIKFRKTIRNGARIYTPVPEALNKGKCMLIFKVNTN